MIPTTPPLPTRPAEGRLDLRQLGGLALMLIIVWLLWHTWWVYPLKILVVFFHELSHGLAAILTGGEIAGIELLAQEGGLCRTLGGNRFLILSAGYLGSLLWGGLILVLASRSRHDPLVTTALGALLLFASLVWVRPIFAFGFPFALLAGAALVLVGLKASEQVNDWLLKTVGLTSMLYAVLDIKDDILDRPHLRESDAAQLAQMTGLPTLAWGVIWIGLAVLGALLFLLVAARGKSKSASL
jgi:Peptidase M50B-like